MTTNLVAAGHPGNEASQQKLRAFREVYGEDGERYFRAGITHQQAGMIHGLTGETLKRRVKELGLPASVLPPPKPQESAEDRYSRSLGSAAAAIERQNPAICGRN